MREKLSCTPVVDLILKFFTSLHLNTKCLTIYTHLIQDRKLVENFWNQPKPKKPVAAAKIVKIPAIEDDEENWKNDLLEH